MNLKFLITIFLFGLARLEESISFTYMNKGTDWKTLFVASCAGTNQSPIDFVTTSRVAATATQVPFDLNMSNTTVKVTYTVGNSIASAGVFSQVNTLDSLGVASVFTSSGFHVHAPSDHTIDGVQGDAELHIVHKLSAQTTSTYQYVVVGIIFKKTAGVDNEILTNWKPSATAGASNSFTMSTAFLASFLKGKGFNTYFGSLTTPPCTESVKFFILDTMLDISDAQLKVFNDLFKSNNAFANGNGNNRVVQALNGRTVNYITTTSTNFRSTFSSASIKVFSMLAFSMIMFWK